MTLSKALKTILALLVALPPALLGQPGLSSEEDKESYRLKAKDVVKLTVYQEDDLTTQATLTSSGEASFPLVKAVKLGGLSLKEAEERLTYLYNKDFLVEPTLFLNLVQEAEEHVAVIGAVLNPRDVPIPQKGGLDIKGALATVGGLSPMADTKRIELIRDSEQTVYTVDQLEKKPVFLKPGDRINVAVSRFAGKTVMVVGEVGKPGTIPFPINGHLDLATLIEAAGGVNEKGDAARIRVKRGARHYIASLSKGGESPIAPGDIVSVPKSAFVGKVVTVMGRVKNPGAVNFPFNGKLTALEAVARAGGFHELAHRNKVFLTRKGKKERLYLEDVAEGKSPRVTLQPGDTLFVDVRVF